MAGSWLRGKEGLRRVVPDLIFLSIVTSIALNTTVQLRLRDERNRQFIIQRELLRRIRDQLKTTRELSNASNVCRQMVLAGLIPSDYGFRGTEAKNAEETTNKWVHPHLSWFDVFFSGKLKQLPDNKYDESVEDEWEKGALHLRFTRYLTYTDFLKLIEDLEKSEGQKNVK